MIDNILFKTACPYHTFFAANKDERSRLLSYKKWQIDTNCVESIKSSAFAPSELWDGWLNDTFVAVNSIGVMIKSGHNFQASRIALADTFKSQIAQIYSKAKRFPKNDISNKNIEKLFHFHYPKNEQTVDPVIKAMHPNPYFRYLEAMHLSGVKENKKHSANTILEIGAGAGASIAHREKLGYTKQFIIDLPDTVEVAFAFLCTVMNSKDIALPNENVTENSKVIFCLPNQCIDRVSEVDLAFNMSSFQEMDLNVVNSYLAFIDQKLNASGYFISCNQEKSRHIGANTVDGWVLGRGFELVSTKSSELQNLHSKRNNLGLVVKCNVWKKGSNQRKKIKFSEIVK